jgi:type 1 fimbria pilin
MGTSIDIVKRATRSLACRTGVAVSLCIATLVSHAQSTPTQLNWNFHAVIGGKTCQVDFPSRVELPHLSASALAAPDETGGATKVSIKLTNCDAAVNLAHFVFNQNPDAQRPQYFRVDPGPTAAQGIAFRLSTVNDTLIRADGASNTVDIPVAAQQGTLDLMIAYVHTTGIVTPGDANGHIEFDVDYP